MRSFASPLFNCAVQAGFSNMRFDGDPAPDAPILKSNGWHFHILPINAQPLDGSVVHGFLRYVRHIFKDCCRW